MQQAHRRAVIGLGHGIRDGVDEHLDDSATDRVGDYRDHKTRKAQHMRQRAHKEQTQRTEHLRRHNEPPVADPVGEFDAQRVDQELHAEVHQNEKADSLQGDAKLILEKNEEQRREVVDDCQCDEAVVAGE